MRRRDEFTVSPLSRPTHAVIAAHIHNSRLLSTTCWFPDFVSPPAPWESQLVRAPLEGKRYLGQQRLQALLALFFGLFKT
jgi:hypothetical protein